MISTLLALTAIAGVNTGHFGAFPDPAHQEPSQAQKDKGLQAAELKAFGEFLANWTKEPSHTIDKKHIAELENDIEVGSSYVPTVEKENKLSKKQGMIDRVERVGRILANVANNLPVKTLWGDSRLSPFPYKFKVIEGEDVNAFSLPGGYIYVYEGLLDFVESDDELAAVLSHEIAHASLRHLAWMVREQSRFDLWSIPIVLASILGGGGESSMGGLILRDLVSKANQSGWSVRAEDSADYAGFQYMVESKFNPVASLTFMERLARHKRVSDIFDWGIYRTHPPTRDRAELLTQYLKEKNLPIKRSLVSSTFRVTLTPGEEEGSVDGYFNARKLFTFYGDSAIARAESASIKLNDFFDTVPDLFEVQAGADGGVLWRKNSLFKFTLEDVSGNAARLPDAASDAVRAVKMSLFSLAYRIWDVR